MGGVRKTQKIVFYEEEGNVETRYLKIPKIINTDISFQLQFGFDYPPSPPEKFKPYMDDVHINGVSISESVE